MGKSKRSFRLTASIACAVFLFLCFAGVFAGMANVHNVSLTANAATVVFDEERVWEFLFEKIGNPYGAAGLMGNLYAESGLRSNNLQNSYETKLGYNDVTYTEAVDNGTYMDFTNDRAGYGLAQWTSSSRKRSLLQYAQSKGTSISDLDMQLEFLYQEMSRSYRSVLNTLTNATSVLEASNAVLMKFEIPADQSEAVQTLRATYGQRYYNKYAVTPTTEAPATTTEAPSTTTQAPEYAAGDINNDGKVDSTDAILLKRHLLKTSLIPADKISFADFDNNNEIDSTDYIQIKRILLGVA